MDSGADGGSYFFYIDGEGAGAEGEGIDQVFAGPGGDVEAVGFAAGEGFGDFGGELEFGVRAAELAHEFGGVVAEFPLAARGEAGDVAGEIDLDAVDVEGLGDLFQNFEFVGAEAGGGDVPQALPPPGADEPVRVLCFEGAALFQFEAAFGAYVDFRETVVPDILNFALAGGFEDFGDPVEAFISPFGDLEIRGGREKAGGVDGEGVAEGEVPGDGADLGVGLIDVVEEVVEPVGWGEGDVAVVGGVELDFDLWGGGWRQEGLEEGSALHAYFLFRMRWRVPLKTFC